MSINIFIVLSSSLARQTSVSLSKKNKREVEVWTCGTFNDIKIIFERISSIVTTKVRVECVHSSFISEEIFSLSPASKHIVNVLYNTN